MSFLTKLSTSKQVLGLRPPHILIIIFGLSKSSYAYFKGSGTGASPRDNDNDDNDDNKIFVMTYSCAIIAPRELCKPFIPHSDIVVEIVSKDMFGYLKPNGARNHDLHVKLCI